MKSMVLFITLCVCVNSLFSQINVTANNTAIYNSGGRAFPFMGAAPATNNRYVDLKEGSPFFQENWSKSILVTPDGKTFQDIVIKLNLMQNQVYYKDSTGKELIISVPLNEIQLQETKKGKVHFINGSILPNTKQGWYLLLVNDTITLLKGFKKLFEEHISYGSPVEYSIKTQENYLVYLGKEEFEVNKPSDFIKVLPSKKSEIEKEAKNISGKLSREEQLSLMATYCNALLKEKSQ